MSKQKVEIDVILTWVPLLLDNSYIDVIDEKTYLVKKHESKISEFFRKIKIKVPTTTKFELDQYAEYVVKAIDGVKSVKEIGELLVSEFGEDIEPVYERLLYFLEILEKRVKVLVFK